MFQEKSVSLGCVINQQLSGLNFCRNRFFLETCRNVSPSYTHTLEMIGRHTRLSMRCRGTKVTIYRDQEEIKLHKNSANKAKEVKE